MELRRDGRFVAAADLLVIGGRHTNVHAATVALSRWMSQPCARGALESGLFVLRAMPNCASVWCVDASQRIDEFVAFVVQRLRGKEHRSNAFIEQFRSSVLLATLRGAVPPPPESLPYRVTAAEKKETVTATSMTINILVPKRRVRSDDNVIVAAEQVHMQRTRVVASVPRSAVDEFLAHALPFPGEFTSWQRQRFDAACEFDLSSADFVAENAQQELDAIRVANGGQRPPRALPNESWDDYLEKLAVYYSGDVINEAHFLVATAQAFWVPRYVQKQEAKRQRVLTQWTNQTRQLQLQAEAKAMRQLPTTGAPPTSSLVFVEAQSSSVVAAPL